jgi:prepilin-type N-terminal cleavage/methylation domain-containing protein
MLGKREKKSGFSLIEIIVSLGIVLIVLASVVPSYFLIRENLSLLRSSYKLSQDLQRAREMASSTRSLEGSVPYGYGVFLRKGEEQYLIYADLNGNERYGAGDRVLETIELESNVYFKQLSDISLSINFKSPDPVTKLSSNEDSTVITLGVRESEKTKNIMVNEGGLIYVEE